MQSVDPIETYAFETIKGISSKKQEIMCNNIIKCSKKWLTLIMLQEKT